jgi:hypothetical protein
LHRPDFRFSTSELWVGLCPNDHQPRTRSRAPAGPGSKNRRGLDFRLQRLERRRDDVAAQLAIQLGRQTRVAARMWNRHRFDDAARAHLFRHRIHGADHRDWKTGSVEFLANHSAAATAGASRGHEQYAVDTFLMKIGTDLLADAAHDRGRALIAGNDVIGGIKFAAADLAFRFHRS